MLGGLPDCPIPRPWGEGSWQGAGQPARGRPGSCSWADVGPGRPPDPRPGLPPQRGFCSRGSPRGSGQGVPGRAGSLPSCAPRRRLPRPQKKLFPFLLLLIPCSCRGLLFSCLLYLIFFTLVSIFSFHCLFSFRYKVVLNPSYFLIPHSFPSPVFPRFPVSRERFNAAVPK